MRLRLFTPPETPENSQGRIRVFLGGSIEMGAAEDWQKNLILHLNAKPYAHLLDLYNPRRADWDPAWLNTADHPEFKKQVDWEITKQKEADIILYYFAPGTISPITLFELGLFHDRNPVIGAHAEYARLGNLQITSAHFPIDIHVGWNDFLDALDQRLDAIAARFNAVPRTSPPPP